MNIELINGQFNINDAIELITKMIQLKVKYHENKIDNSTSEEDIKFREAKIKNLQNQLFEFRKSIEAYPDKISLNAVVNWGN